MKNLFDILLNTLEALANVVLDAVLMDDAEWDRNGFSKIDDVS